MAKKKKKKKKLKLQIPFLNNKKKKKTGKKKGKDEKKKNKVLIGLMYGGIGLIGGLLALFISVIIAAPTFDVNELYNQESTVLLDINGDVFATIGPENRILVLYEDLPQVLIDAIIATEDSRFYQHGGFDLPRFIVAMSQQMMGNRAAGGASTLTMQIAGNTFTDRRVATGLRGMFRKLTDIYISVFQIERSFTKEEIMEFYVNSEWLASNSWGVEQASLTLFGKSVSDLNLSEAALMAGLFQAPNAFNPFNNPEAATARRETVLNLMVRHGYISEEERNFANSIPVESMLTTRTAGTTTNLNQGFVDTVVEEVIERTGHNPYSVSMIIQTTMNPEIQNVMNDLMSGELFNFFSDHVQNAVAITSVHDGSIVGIATGRNRTGERSFNLATQMNRHLGSSAKPMFAYGPNIEFNNGSSFSLVFDDGPYFYTTGQRVHNADRGYQGLMTSRTALTRSRNIPAVQLFHDLRPDDIAQFARGTGVDFGPTLFEACSLGGCDGGSPLVLSAAYATFARGGYYIEPFSFTRITYRSTGNVFEHRPRRVRVMSEETAAIVNFMNVSSGTAGVGGPIRVAGTDIGAKTGTSNWPAEVRRAFGFPAGAIPDSWLGVYSPDYSIGIWLGYERAVRGQWMTMSQAVNARRQISALVGNRVFRPNSRFTNPSGVVLVEVEMYTFPPMLPSPHTPGNLRTTEMFRRGTEPTEVSWRFSQLANPTNANFTASGNNITLSWDSIETPNAVNRIFLENHFATFYRQWADQYLRQRLAWNDSHFGHFGYRIFRREANGNLTEIGFTRDNTFTVPNAGGNNTFGIRSSYSIFRANMSAGLEITTSTIPIIPPPPPDEIPPNGNGMGDGYPSNLYP